MNRNSLNRSHPDWVSLILGIFSLTQEDLPLSKRTTGTFFFGSTTLSRTTSAGTPSLYCHRRSWTIPRGRPSVVLLPWSQCFDVHYLRRSLDLLEPSPKRRSTLRSILTSGHRRSTLGFVSSFDSVLSWGLSTFHTLIYIHKKVRWWKHHLTMRWYLFIMSWTIYQLTYLLGFRSTYTRSTGTICKDVTT